MTELRQTPPRLTWRARLAIRALPTSLAMLGAALAEAACVTIRAPGVAWRFGVFVGAFAKIQAFALLFGLVLSALSLAPSALLARLRERGLLGAPGDRRRIDFVAATLLVAPVATLLSYWTILALSRDFKNRELAALAGALLASCGAYLALLPWAWLLLVSRALRERLPAPFGGVVLLPGATLSLLTLASLWTSAGLAQLDPWLLAAPLVAFALLPAALRMTGRVARNLALAVLATGSVLALLGGTVSEATAARLFQAGAWSRPAITLLRRLTDFDRDGYSGWFDGGDCAPFDARVHPGAREVPRDGLDNNCLGGDGGHDTPEPPRPSPRSRLNGGPRLNLVLVTIETLRADHVSFLGYSRPTTPRLSELAKSSVVFELSYATTPTTRLSLAALLSGKLPSSLHWLSQSYEKQMRRLAPDAPWLPAALSKQGYVTLAVHANFRAFTPQENAGFSRGFVRYDTSTEVVYSGGTMHGFPGGAQVDRALALLDETAAGRPLFLWLHLLEPHYLYEQSANVPRFGDDELARYDAEIAEADRQVGRLLDGLRSRNLLDTTLFAVTGDHGEEFGEHGQRWHGSNLYDPQLRTATLWHVPGLGPKRIAEPVSFLDFVPSVLDLLGLEGELEPSMGRNLVPLLRDAGPIAPGFFVENFKVDDGSQVLLGLVDWPFKLLRTGSDAKLELYDLRQDPRETRDLWQPNEPTSRRLANRLYEYVESGLARGVTQDDSP